MNVLYPKLARNSIEKRPQYSADAGGFAREQLTRKSHQNVTTLNILFNLLIYIISVALEGTGTILMLVSPEAGERHSSQSSLTVQSAKHWTVVKVPHVNQKDKWDCGLACVVMVLQAAGLSDCDLESLKDRCPTTSIWTVDLAYLLRQFGAQLVFSTVTLGANPEFASESFYMDHIQEDQRRVNQLFNDAPAAGIPICQCSLPSETLKKIIRTGAYVVIALVEKNVLRIQSNRAAWGRRPICDDQGGYIGHYIVICGYHCSSRQYLIKDPATRNAGGVWVSADALEAARKSYGTDEDLLIVSLRNSTQLDLMKWFESESGSEG